MGVGHGRIEAADRRRALGRGRARDRHAGARQRGRAPRARRSPSGSRRGCARPGSRWSARTAWASPRPGFPSPWIGSLHPTFVPGPVATLVHSGSIGEILVSLGPRIGFRTVISAGNETVTDAADFVAWFADDPATRVVGLFLEAVRRPGGVRGGAAAAGRGGQGGDRAQGRHVGARRAGGARAHRRAGRLRPQLLGDAAPLRRDPGGRLRRLARAPGGVLARRGRRAAAASARSRTPAARASTSPTRPSRPGIPLSALLRRAAGADRGRVPELHPRRQPGRLLGDRRRPGRLPARLPADGRVGRVRRAACRPSTTATGCTGTERQLATNIADDLRAAVEGTDLFPARDHGDHRRPAGRGPARGRARTTSRC